LETLTGLKTKLEKKKMTIKDIIEKKIEDNQKELKKWKELLFTVVDESLDEKIEKLDSQVTYDPLVTLIFTLHSSFQPFISFILCTSL
jgi:guanylate kinase